MRYRLTAAAALVLALSACHKDQTRGVDGTPVAPDSIDFGLVPVNGRRVLPIPVTNTGAIAVTLQDSRADEPFGVSALPDAPVDPGDSRDVTVVFNPIAAGEVNGTVTLLSNSLVAPAVEVKVHGIAYQADLALAPTRLDFGNVNVGAAATLSFVVSNRSPVPLAPVVEPTELRSDFNSSPTGDLGPLLPSGSSTVTVTFTPSVAGPATSGLVVTCAVCPNRQIELAGVGVAVAPPPPPPPPPGALTVTPLALTFVAQAPNAPAAQQVQLRNTGGQALTWAGTDDDPGVTLGSTGGTLQPGVATTIDVTVAGQPAAGHRPATATFDAGTAGKKVVALDITFTSAPPPPPPPALLAVTPLLLSFTAQIPNAPSAQSLSISNAGGVTLSWVGSSGDTAVTLAPASGSLDGGKSAFATVSVTAQAVAGKRTSTLLIDGGAAGQKTVTLDIEFTSAPPAPECTLSVSPALVDFGTLKAGQSARRTVTYSNTGTGTCFVQLPYRAAGTDDSLQVDGLVAFNLQPGDSKPFTAHFDPVAATAREVSGQLIAVSNDKVNSPTTVSLRGATEAPPPPPPPPGVLVVTPLLLTFTAQVPNTPSSQQVQLRNTGGTALAWNGTDDDANVTLGTTSGTLAPGAAATVDVSVAGQPTAGHRVSHATFAAGTAGSATVTLDLTFTAAPPPPPPPAQLVVTPLVLNFKAQIPAAPPTQSISISNAGGVALSWTGSSSDAAVAVAPASGTLNGGKGQFAAVSVAAQPFAETRTSTLVINAGTAGQATVVLNIVFTDPPPPPPPPQYGTSVWPKWHHDNTNSGLSQIDTSKWKGVKAWKAQIGPPVACIRDNRTGQVTRCGTNVSSPTLDGDGHVIQLAGDGTVYLFDRDDGHTRWSQMTAPPWISGQEGTPTVVKDGSIFQMTAGESCTVGHPCTAQFYKLNGKNGNILWSNQDSVGGDCGREKCDGYDSCPAIDSDGTLYEADDDRGTIDVFDQSGNPLGKIDLSPRDDIETLGGALAPDSIGYWSANGRLWALGPTSQYWSLGAPEIDPTADFPPRANSHNVKSGTLVTVSGLVIYTYEKASSNGDVTTRIWAYKAGKTKPTKPVWMTQLGPTKPRPGLTPGGGLPADDYDAIHYRAGITSAAVGPEGFIYVGHVDGLYQLNPINGHMNWGYGMGSVVSSPAVGKDGTVYVGSSDGLLYGINPDRTTKGVFRTDGQVNSSPAIGADGTVYIASDDGYVYAVK